MQSLSPTRMVLVVATTLFLVLAAVVMAPQRTTSKSSSLAPGATARAPILPFVNALDWFPRNPNRDGSVDYTSNLQAAIDAAEGGTLVLPDFPVRVTKRPGAGHCLLVRAPIEIRGSPASAIVESAGACQILRVENVKGVRLTGFTLRGRGGQGLGLAHGILQVFGGEDVRIEGVTTTDSDADGIVIADAKRISIRGCTSIRASKSGIYVSRCVGGVVADNVVEDGVGHRTGQGSLVGTGIQLSSSVDVACTGNVVRNGIGIGILLDANSTGVAPSGCSIVGNRVSGWRNTSNPDVSSGIRLQNSATVTKTRSLVAANSIERCGTHGIYVENQDSVSILGNTVQQSDRSSICISTSNGVHVLSNVVLESDASGSGSQSGLHLINGAAGVVAQGNRIEARATSPYVPATLDQSSGGGNSLEAQQRRANSAPTTGLWSRGDTIWNTEPWPGAPIGWVCASGGTPGVWSAFGRIE